MPLVITDEQLEEGLTIMKNHCKLVMSKQTSLAFKTEV